MTAFFSTWIFLKTVFFIVKSSLSAFKRCIGLILYWTYRWRDKCIWILKISRRKKWRHNQTWQILPYFDLKIQISCERFIQSWQTIQFFSSLNHALFDSVTRFSAFGHPKNNVVRVLHLCHLTPQREGYFGLFHHKLVLRH